MKNGFFITIGNKGIVLESKLTRKTDRVIDALIDAIGALKGLDAAFIENCKKHEPTRKDVAYKTIRATIERMNVSFEAYEIKSKYMTACYPIEDFEREITVVSM